MTLLKDRPVAGDAGTDERITCPDGYYWVRIVTREALKREGLAMVNCLAMKDHTDFVGHERLNAPLVWSLRRVSDGRSIVDVEVFDEGALGLVRWNGGRPTIGVDMQVRQ